MGSAAPLVQPDAPGHTVPGAAPSAKFTKANDPPLSDRIDRALPSGNGAAGRSALQAANSRTHPKAITRFMAQPPWGVEGGQRKFRTLVLHTSAARTGRNHSVEGDAGTRQRSRARHSGGSVGGRLRSRLTARVRPSRLQTASREARRFSSLASHYRYESAA